MRTVSLILLLALACAVSAQSSMLPKIANPGFEEVAPGNDAPGWGWVCGAAAGFQSDTSNPHSGKRCLVFHNQTEMIPNVYGRLSQSFGVLPGTEYELSTWVRGENVAEGQHFTDWGSYTLSIPSGTYGWKKISTKFRTGKDQGGLALGINICNKATALAVDDITLVPVGTPIKGNGVTGSYIVPGRVAGDDKPTSIALNLDSSLGAGAKVEVKVASGKEVLFWKSQPLSPGDNALELQWNTGKTTTRNLRVTMQVFNSKGAVVASAEQRVEKMSPGILLAAIDDVDNRLHGEFADLYAGCESKGIPIDYPTATKTMLEQFIPLERQDAVSGQERRADFSITDFNRALDQSIANMKAYLKDPKVAPIVPRYQTGAVRVEGLDLIGTRKDSKGNMDQGPLFFCGYGHFSQAQKDTPRFPGYGVNIIQSADFGPSAIFPEEGKIDLTAAKRLVNTLDNAAKANVKVDFLISPHYFPDWARAKWPNINDAGYAFCVDEPEGRHIIEQFLRIVVPMIKDKPALNSICLSNEPAFTNYGGCHYTKPKWIDYLKVKYGSLDSLNSRWGTTYASFDDIPLGGGYDDPPFYDFCMFNKRRFADWHKWMADIIHDMMPDAKVHAKLCVVWDLPSRQYAPWGVDIEMFSHLSDFNGNDCYILPTSGEWGIGWHLQNMTLDLQRSMARKPIYDSEHHLQSDGTTAYVPPQHYRTALWQGAIHGEGMSTQWVWERAGHPSFYGNVMDRPGCALETGRTCMDLNRFAREVSALENAKAPVAIVYSKASYMKDGGYIDAMNRTHEALNFCGVKVDFISEDQLAEGNGRYYKVIVLPRCSHLTDGAVKGLSELPQSVRLVAIGDTPKFDPYHKPIPEDAATKIAKRCFAIDGKTPSKELWPIFIDQLGKAGGLPEVSVVDAKTGKPAWGVEWLPAQVNGKTVINIVDLLSKPVDVKVLKNGKPVKARDLLSLGGKAKVGHLESITPVLAEL